MSTCLCMCEPMETAQSLGDDTHAVVKRPKWPSEHERHTACGPLCWLVTSLAHQQVLGTRTRAELNVSPRPLMQHTGKEKENTRCEKRKIHGMTANKGGTAFSMAE